MCSPGLFEINFYILGALNALIISLTCQIEKSNFLGDTLLLENQLSDLEPIFVVHQRRAISFPLFPISCVTAPKSSSVPPTKSERSCDLCSFIERTFLSDFRKPFQSKSHFLQSSVSKWTKSILNIAPFTSEFVRCKKCNSGQLQTASTSNFEY